MLYIFASAADQAIVYHMLRMEKKTNAIYTSTHYCTSYKAQAHIVIQFQHPQAHFITE